MKKLFLACGAMIILFAAFILAFPATLVRDITISLPLLDQGERVTLKDRPSIRQFLGFVQEARRDSTHQAMDSLAQYQQGGGKQIFLVRQRSRLLHDTTWSIWVAAEGKVYMECIMPRSGPQPVFYEAPLELADWLQGKLKRVGSDL